MIWFITAFVKSLSWIIVHLPRRVQIWIGQCLGLVWYYIVPIRRSLVIHHISLAFPDWPLEKRKEMARANYMNYGCGFVELLMLPCFNERIFKKLFIVEGFDKYQKAAAQGKGVFVLSLHLGSWELTSACSKHLGIPLHMITKKLKTKGLNQVWFNLRLNSGFNLIEGEKTTFQILRTLRAGGAVGFILDQFMGPPIGVRTKFFGIETGTAAGLALFADRTRAPVVLVYNIRQKDGRIRLVFDEEIPFMERGSTDENISFMTQVYTSKIESIVKRYPEQWMWLHRRWKPFRE